MINTNAKIKKTVIFAGYHCNNRCIFCINYDKRNIPSPSTKDIKKEIILAKKRGSTYLELIGGEPTIRPDIIELIQFAKKIGFNTIMIATNGRMLSYYEFAEKILKAGLNSIVFSIHGHNAKLHDSLTQVPGSFKQINQGIKNVKEIIKKMHLNVSLGTNTTIVKQNYKYLFQIGEYIRKLGLYNAEFIFVDPSYGGAYNFFDKLVPKISEIAPYVHKCLDIGKKYKIPHWHIRYVPLCYFTDYLNQISELHEIEIYDNTEHVAPDFYDEDAIRNRQEKGRLKTKKCKGCILYNKCEGLWKEYIKRYGDAELKPVKTINK
ncbi:MAG: radical SAM protein [Minisyncoccia bacterium]